MAKITWADKSDYRNLGAGIPADQKVVAEDMNEVKASVNALYDLIPGLRIPRTILVTSADFGGRDYQNPALIGYTAGVDFNIWTNDGSGTLLTPTDGYSFVSSTGIITTEPGNYKIILFATVL